MLPKDKFGEALTYLRNQWEALQLYLSDGRLPIDNNEVEQLMKQVQHQVEAVGAAGKRQAVGCERGGSVSERGLADAGEQAVRHDRIQASVFKLALAPVLRSTHDDDSLGNSQV